MRKVGFFIVCALIVLVTAAGTFFGITYLNRKTQEETFSAAMEEFRQAIVADEVDVDLIHELSENIYSDENYAYVEEAAKTYLRDIFVPYYSMQALEQKAPFKDGITKELIESDQPNFEKSLKNIDSMSEYSSLVYAVADSLFSHETALEYLGNKDELAEMGDYYIELYEDQIEEIYDDKDMQRELFNYYAKMDKKCTAYKEVINFLINNSGSWHIEGDSVVFKTTWMTNQYNQLLANIAQ